MAPEGTIISRVDKRGNRMASSGREDRLCVLVGSNGNPEYSSGKRVVWLVSSQGEHVDFSSTYHLLDETDDLPGEERERVDNEEVERGSGGFDIELVLYAGNKVGRALVLGRKKSLIGNRIGPQKVRIIQEGRLFERDALVVGYDSYTGFVRRGTLSRLLGVDESRVVDSWHVLDFEYCIGHPQSELTKSLGRIVVPYLRGVEELRRIEEGR